MTLKEKFHQWLNTEPFSSKDRPTLREAQCEQIADDYAIEFAEWFWYHGRKYWRGERTDYLDMSEILEIFKKEKGL